MNNVENVYEKQLLITLIPNQEKKKKKKINPTEIVVKFPLNSQVTAD